MGTGLEIAVARSPKAEFEQHAITHRNYLYNLALSLTRDKFTSDDLVQETYLKAFAHFDLFHQDSNCLAWLSRIMLNTFINSYNRKKRSPLSYGLEVAWSEPAIDPASSADYTDPDYLFHSASDEVKKALQSLPADYRQMIILSDMAGLPYKDISRLSGTPMGTVRSRLSRGRYLLRRRLIKSGFISAN